MCIITLMQMMQKAVYTQKNDAKKPPYNTSLKETGGKQSHGWEYDEDVDKGEERASIIDGLNSRENVVSGAKIEHANIQSPQESSTPASATKTPVLQEATNPLTLHAQRNVCSYTVAVDTHQCSHYTHTHTHTHTHTDNAWSHKTL